ncbi:type II secretion system F family protein [Acidovorax sp. sic0104]|uniref:type II secretion system F family protein n=1 Tax=Acidovorax sp. sic0104 TaxID=2854784 RepID=UPI001C46B829|nr:type II secretion system F family protein [Acidovorax sp. sic0104]MBV7542140.1 type II secretion system F family protein [Acidovorax sp. sic0104]
MSTYYASVKIGPRIQEILVSGPNEKAARAEAARRGIVVGMKKANNFVLGRRMSIADRTVFFQRLSSMVASKVSMSEALKVIHDSFSGVVREVAAILRQHIENGATLPEAMDLAGEKYFPETVRALVKTSSHGGDIAHSLREAARFELELAAVKKESGRGLWSASLGFLTGVGTLFGSTLYVGPMIMNSDLMKIGKASVDVSWVVTLSSALNWSLGIIVALLLTALMSLFIAKPIMPAVVDRVILKIPFYRDLVLAKQNYIVFFGLGILLNAGLRLEECLRLSRDNSPPGELREDMERARNAITKGSRTPWPYLMTTLHPTDKAALATAQDRSQTALTISELAIQYRNLYRQRISVFVPVAQVLAALFLSLAGVVLFGVAIVPMLQMTNGILAGM